MDYKHREPTDKELQLIEDSFNSYYHFGDQSLDTWPVCIIEDYEMGSGSYSGRLAIAVDGGANTTTFGFDEDGVPFVFKDVMGIEGDHA